MSMLKGKELRHHKLTDSCQFNGDRHFRRNEGGGWHFWYGIPWFGLTESAFIGDFQARVLDNVQVYFENIHVRVEDNLSNSKHPCACGFTLRGVRIQSTDSNWQPEFVPKRKIVYKVSLSLHLTD